MNESRPQGISVIICSYNGASRIAATLEHLARQELRSNIRWEILLVDNNSTDNTLNYSLECWKQYGAPVPLRSFKQPKPGKNYALEMAYDEAIFEFMCIVDDDNWLETKYLEIGFDLLSANKEMGLLGGRSVGAFESPMPIWFSKISRTYAVGDPVLYTGQPLRLLSEQGVITYGSLCGAGLFVRYAAWNLLKQANFESLLNGRKGEKQLMGGEDDELCYAVRLTGYQMWYTPALCLTHFMTKNRLTMDYAPRIIHSFSQTYSRLSIYRRLIYNPTIDYSKISPWIKDFVYMTLRVFNHKRLIKYLKLWKKNDIEYLVMREDFYTWINFIKDFRNMRSNYLKVKDMQERALSILKS